MAGGEEDGGQAGGNGEQADPRHGTDHGDRDVLDGDSDGEGWVVERQYG